MVVGGGWRVVGGVLFPCRSGMSRVEDGATARDGDQGEGGGEGEGEGEGEGGEGGGGEEGRKMKREER